MKLKKENRERPKEGARVPFAQSTNGNTVVGLTYHLHLPVQNVHKSMRCLLKLLTRSCSYYRPQRSCGQGYVFTRVRDSVHGGGICLSVCLDTTTPPREGGTPWDTTPLKEAPPRRKHPREGSTPLPPAYGQ